MSQDFKNILIIKPSSLGDIIQALPALSALRRSFPAAHISWLVRTEFTPLLENHPHLTEIIPFDRKFLGKAWYHPKALAALFSLIRRLRRAKFDMVFDFQGLFRTASLAWLSGCKSRFGKTPAEEFAHLLYTQKVPQTQNCIHLVDYYLKIIQAAGVSNLAVDFILPEQPSAADTITRLLKRQNIAGHNYAVLVPGSAHADKCWPIDRFAALADRISSDFGLSIVATGTKSEKPVVDTLANLTGRGVPIANLAGKTSIPELIELLRNARLVVSNDTGPGHIAAALGTPLVLIFGRSNPARVAPYARPHCVAAVEPHCRGFNADSPDPKHNIKHITLDQVYDKVSEQLKPSSL